MYSYKEFPEQVELEMQIFAEENNFELIEKEEDHCVRYRNRVWELYFFCDHGAVELSLINLNDGYEYSLYDILELWFPDSYYSKKMNENIWGSLETIKFNAEALNNHYSEISHNYNTDKERLTEYKRRSHVLINFVMSKGSDKLKNEFTLSSDKWIELASNEYIKSKN
ncbi:hypothetical protein [Aquimarina rubra]|uniref:Uncharacterized protein n=1 Tax=Aquimarina rubra TaxID=1920033 RepID=A0ABW5LIU2_9FLAO